MIIDIVLKYIDMKGLTPHKFEQTVGLSNAYLANIKKSNSEIQPKKLKLILEKYPDLESYLESDIESNPARDDIDGIPLIPWEAIAGKGLEIMESLEAYKIEERYVIPLFRGLQVDFMIPVKGSSMYPKYASGDVVACRIVKELIFVQWNKTYVLDTLSQGIILKRLKKSSKESHVLCRSDNKDYEDFELPLSEIRSIALVVGVIRLE